MLHPPTRRVKPGNPVIFQMPPVTFFLIYQGAGKEAKRLERGIGLKTHSRPLPIARERWRKVEPEDTEPESPRLRRPSSGGDTVPHGPHSHPHPSNAELTLTFKA